MRFWMRTAGGLLQVAFALALVGWGAHAVVGRSPARDTGPPRAAAERVFAVEIGTVAVGEARPVVSAYGEIRAGRRLEIRAGAAGRLVHISPKLRDGAETAAGELLFRIDPADYEARVADAEAARREAAANLAEARQAVEVAREETRSAELQRDLRAAGLARRRTLLGRGVATTAEFEEAEMALAAAAQAVSGRMQAAIAAEIRIERAGLGLERAEIALAEARRALAETETRAPFSGIVAEVDAVEGGLVATNERLAALIDPAALEVAFRLSSAEFARIVAPGGSVPPLPFEASLALDGAAFAASGALARAGAESGSGETGRLIWGRLDPSSAGLLRPGDFVTVRLGEPPLAGVAVLPAAAVSETGEMLLVDAEDRLRPHAVGILRRQGDAVIVAGAPDGARYLRARAPQLGAGVKVRPLPPAEEPAAPDLAALSDGPVVELDPARRDRLIRHVETAGAMNEATRAGLLAALRSGRASSALVERLEARMGRSG